MIRQLFEGLLSRWKGRSSDVLPRKQKVYAPTSADWYSHKHLGGPHPLVNCRFVKSEMDGMGVCARNQKWGTITAIDIGRTERGLVYDGNQSQEMREYYRKKGHDTWARIKYDDGSEAWEPVWWFSYPTLHREELAGTSFYVEYQI